MPVENENTLQNELAALTIGCRVQFKWLGQSKALDDIETNQAAAAFGATKEAMRAAKKLFNTKNAAYCVVTGIRSQIKRFWKLHTLPYVEKSIRLIRSDTATIEAFEAQMNAYRAELATAVDALEAEYGAIKAERRATLANLYSESDYPASLVDCFALFFDYPAIRPDNRLATIAPELFERETRRMQARFELAGNLAEEAFIAELGKMVDDVVNTLNGNKDGKRKIFRDNKIEKFEAFFERFRTLSIGSSAQLNALVESAQNAINGISPNALRKSEALRVQVATQFEAIGAEIAGAMVDKPARRIRFGQAANSASGENSPAPVAEVEAASVDDSESGAASFDYNAEVEALRGEAFANMV